MKITLLALLSAFYLTVYTKIICPKNCLNCTSSTSCTTCSTGYYLDSTSFCRPCNPGCRSCTPPAPTAATGPTCTACVQGFTYNSQKNECFVCDLTCKTCSLIPSNCTSCNEGFNLDGNGKCTRDPNCTNDRCLSCQSNSNVLCTGCKTGYFLQANGSCETCPYPCGACTFDVNTNQIVQQFTQGVHEIENIGQTLSQYVEQIKDYLVRYSTYMQTKAVNPAVTFDMFLVGGNFSLLTDPVNLNFRGPNFANRILNLQQYYGLFADQTFFQTIANQIQQNQTQAENLITAVMGGDLASLAQLTALTTEISNNLKPEVLLLLLYNQPQLKVYFNGTFDELIGNITRITIDWTRAPALCSGCIRGFYFYSPINFCFPCQKECLRCNQTDCFQCAENHFVLNRNQCSRCQFPCTQCQGSPTNCTSCIFPYKLSQLGVCTYCQAPCSECSASNGSQCTSCILPFSRWANANGQCFRCSQDVCQVCLQANTTFCIDCLAEQTPVDGKCQTCPPNCLECMYNSSTTTFKCLLCKQRHYLNNQSQCQPCDQGCIICTPTVDLTSTLCVACQKGTFRNSEGKCQLCSDACSQCTNAEYCTVFKDNFIKFGNQFVKCRPGCSSCLGNNPQVCLTCEDKYVFSGTLCKKCADGCENCTVNDVNVCTECSNGRYLDTGKCLKCSENCTSCLSAAQCTSCKRGFILNSSSCIQAKNLCQKNCINCDLVSKKCMECEFGFVLAPNGKCVRCTSNCGASCDASNPVACTNCMIGFTKVDGKCVRCPPNCKQCSNGSCLECNRGFKLSQNNSVLICVKDCIFPCKNCTNDKCLQCVGNFTLTDGKCEPDVTCGGNGCAFCPMGSFKSSVDNSCKKCIANCGSCDSETACKVCREGFYNSNDTCVSCPQGTLHCLDASTSLLCKPGYVIKAISFDPSQITSATFSTTCEPCQTPCKQCMILPTICLSCANDDYRLNGTTCMKKLVVGVHVKFDYNFTQFLNQGLIETIISYLQTNILGKFIITYVSQGSVNLGIAAQPTTTDHGTLSSSISSSIQNNGLGIPVISSSVGIYIEDQSLASEQAKKNQVGMIVGIVVGSVVFVVLVFLGSYYLYKRSRNNKTVQQLNNTNNDLKPHNPNQKQPKQINDFKIQQNISNTFENDTKIKQSTSQLDLVDKNKNSMARQ